MNAGKIFLGLSIALLSFSTSFAQKIKEAEVPTVVKENFAKKYPNVKILSYEKEKGDFEIGFYMNKIVSSAIFDPNGVFKAFEQEISPFDLPKNVRDYCLKNFAEFRLTEGAKITDNEGKLFFEAEMSKGKQHFDAIFDADGNFVRKEAMETSDSK